MRTEPYFQKWFSADEFRARHQRIYNAIGDMSAVVLQGAPPVSGFEVFRQTNEFFYLTGLEVPQAYLILDGRQKKSRLFLPRQNAQHAAKDGEELSADDANLLKQLTGADDVAELSAIDVQLKQFATIYTPHSPAEGNMACQDTLRAAAKLIAADSWDNTSPRESSFIELIKNRCPKAEIQDLSPILNTLRSIKSTAEINLMRFTGQLTANAVTEAIRSTRPGLHEYHLGAIAEYIYRLNGGRGEGYRPIIAAGDNIWTIHYYRNNCILKDGDLVLMDVAPDVCNYTNDIGRMWPVNGKYDNLQRQLYGFMVELHKALLSCLRPGVMPARISAEAREKVRPLVAKMKFKNTNHERGVMKALESDGHLTHPVGMAVHDVGTYKTEPFKPGCVFALDPQMWIPEEKIYIRVEDTVVITETGVENLTGSAPLELDDVEAAMRGSGILQAFPPLPRKTTTGRITFPVPSPGNPGEG